MSIANRREYLRQPVGRSPVDEFLQAMPIGGTRSGILGAAGTGFSPADIASLAHWYDATEISGSDGDAIGTWTDQEGSNDLTQSTSSKKPTLKTNIQNGNQVLRFDGSDDSIANSSVSITQAITSFAVVPNATLSSSANDQVWGRTDNGENDVGVNTESSSEKWAMFAGSELVGTATSPAVILTATFNGGSSVLRENGSQTVSGSAGSSDISSLKVGNFDSNGRPFDGDISEVLLYDADLSDSDRDDVESYLSDKWGITI